MTVKPLVALLLTLLSLVAPSGYSASPLWNAASKGDTKTVETILDRGSNVDERANERMTTPLMIAAAGGHMETVRCLVNRGADVNAKSHWDGGSISVLRMTVLNKQSNVAMFLLESGANINEAITGIQDQMSKSSRDPAMNETRRAQSLKYQQAGLDLLSKLAAERDASAFLEFQKKARTWRALPVKPALAEGVQRARVLAEDAFRSKNLGEAIGYYEKGLASEPLWPAGHYNAALLCGEENLYATAVSHMKRYLELCPDAKDAQAAREQMYVWEAKAKIPPSGILK